jgi:hypothetical protein
MSLHPPGFIEPCLPIDTQAANQTRPQAFFVITLRRPGESLCLSHEAIAEAALLSRATVQGGSAGIRPRRPSTPCVTAWMHSGVICEGVIPSRAEPSTVS